MGFHPVLYLGSIGQSIAISFDLSTVGPVWLPSASSLMYRLVPRNASFAFSTETEQPVARRRLNPSSSAMTCIMATARRRAAAPLRQRSQHGAAEQTDGRARRVAVCEQGRAGELRQRSRSCRRCGTVRHAAAHRAWSPRGLRCLKPRTSTNTAASASASHRSSPHR
jgi:hypothetical protein